MKLFATREHHVSSRRATCRFTETETLEKKTSRESLIVANVSENRNGVVGFRVRYKHLMQNSPGGIYLVPSFADLHVWYGVIFVRRGDAPASFSLV